MHPRFSDDHSKLAYVGCEEKFLSHTTNFKLKTIAWPPNETASSDTVLPQYEVYPSDQDEFCGLYGWGNTYVPSQFLPGSSRFFVIQSFFKGSTRIFIVDTDSKVVKMLRITGVTHDDNLRFGHYSLMKTF